MAKRKNKKEELSLIENPEALISKTEVFFNDKKNQNIVFSVGGVIGALVLGYLLYNYYMTSRNAEAQEEMFQAVYYFERDSLTKALNGDGNNYGFLDINEYYSGTTAANLSSFYIGNIYLKLKNFETALRYFKEFSSSDMLIQARAYSLLGDTYMELDDFDKAISYFKKAANHKPNKTFTPTYLMKLALAQELNSDLQSAIESYDKIISAYFDSNIYQEAVKHQSRLKGLQTE